MAAPLPGASLSFAVIGSPASSVAVMAAPFEFAEASLLLLAGRGIHSRVGRVTELCDELGVEQPTATCR